MTNYSERISHNEKRIAELKGRMYTDKLTIKSLENENERCFEAMNNCTSPIDVDKTEKDKKILELTKTIGELENKNKILRKEKRQLKTELEYTKEKLNGKIKKLELKLLMNEKSDDVILADNFGEHNIFMELME